MPTAPRTTEYRYNGDGRLTQLIAHNAETSESGEQVTTWEYGTTLAESGMASFDLVKAKVYPDDVSGSGRVEYRYDRLGELTGTTQ